MSFFEFDVDQVKRDVEAANDSANEYISAADEKVSDIENAKERIQSVVGDLEEIVYKLDKLSDIESELQGGMDELQEHDIYV